MVGQTFAEAIGWATNELRQSSDSSMADARVLMCHVLKCDMAHLLCRMQEKIADDTMEQFSGFVARRKQCEPIAYILGYRDFMSMRFKVAKGVLIPRPDTEILVEHVIKQLEGKQVNILELCTGSGCIAVALANYLPKSNVTAIDISEDALNIARENVKAHRLEQKVNIKKGDIFSFNEFDSKIFDAIISNPPYIRAVDVENLMADVRDYEPKLALDGGLDGLDFYRRIAQICQNSLKKGGLLAVEIGEGMADEVVGLFEDVLNDVLVIKDLSEIDRVVTGVRR